MNLALRASLDTDPTKLPHSSSKSGIEVSGVVGEIEDGGLGSRVGEENLVGGEEALAGDQVLKIGIIEGLWGVKVESDDDTWIGVA